MEFEQIIQLIKAVSDSSLTEFKIEDKDFKISLKANQGQVFIEQQQISNPVIVSSTQNNAVDVDLNQDTCSGKVVKSPLVGTYYAAQSEESVPFVAVGDTVKKGQVIGIIEAMKLMNEVECEFDGVVKEILVENQQMVEYGQPIIRIG